jgi:predicted lipid carrier protein YhbT
MLQLDKRATEQALADVAMAMRRPVEVLLNRAIRRAWRRSPAAFGRLGRYQGCRYLIAPTDLPVAFELRLESGGGQVRIVRRDATPGCIAAVAGALPDLLALFEASADADAIFFSGALDVTGDTAAIMALHNALEAADLRLADLLAPAALSPGLEPLLRRLLDWRRATLQPRGAHGID